MTKPLQLVGQKFGRWTVISRAGNTPRDVKWLCVCSCGNSKEVYTGNLRNGGSRSCGCLRAEEAAIRASQRATHGASGTSLYKKWMGMLDRCRNENGTAFKNYGGRGIEVCERWQSFKNFSADMGKCPSPRHSIDRIDNDKGYSPDNCRWALPIDQSRNRRNTIRVTRNGVTKLLIDWADDIGLDAHSMYHRYRNLGLRGDDLFRPPRTEKILITRNGETKTLTQWAAQIGITRPGLYFRYKKGLTGDDLFSPPAPPQCRRGHASPKLVK